MRQGYPKTTKSVNNVTAIRGKPHAPHLRIRDAYLDCYRHTIYALGHFRQYGEGIYEVVPELSVKRRLQEIAAALNLPDFDITAPNISSVTELLRAYVSVPDSVFDGDVDVLAFDDCILNLTTFRREPHSPKRYLTSKLPFNYDTKAKSLAWAKWCARVDPEVLAFLQEYGGCCLTTDTRFELAVWLYGQPGGGRSTFLEGLKAALGPSRWTTLSPADLSNRFGLARLPGKTLATCAEVPSHSPKYLHILNSLVSGESLHVEAKYQHGYDFTPRVKLLWAMNTLPNVNDANDGLFRRVQLVYLPPLRKADQDPLIKEEIIASGQAIVNWFLAGLKRLRERGAFDIPDSVRQATEVFKDSNDFVKSFVNECCEPGDYKQPAKEIFDAYRHWASDNGIRYPMNSKKFKAELERLGFTWMRSDGSKYAGLKII